MSQKDETKVQCIEHMKEELDWLAPKVKILEVLEGCLSRFIRNKFIELFPLGGSVSLNNQYYIPGSGRDAASHADRGKGSFFIIFCRPLASGRPSLNAEVIGEGRWLSKEIKFRDQCSHPDCPHQEKNFRPFLEDFFKAMEFKILKEEEYFSSGENQAMWLSLW